MKRKIVIWSLISLFLAAMIGGIIVVAQGIKSFNLPDADFSKEPKKYELLVDKTDGEALTYQAVHMC